MASALRRLVDEIQNARAEGLRVDQLQRLLIAPVLKQTLSAPHDDGMDHEPKFVEKVLFKQRPDQGRAAGYRDVLARLLLELGDLLGEVVPYQGGVLPLEGLLETTYFLTPFICAATGFSSGSCFGQNAAHSS